MADDIYDCIIIGGGPAGLTAGLYAQRARMKTAVIEKGMAGGQLLLSEIIENYPGFPQGVGGFEFAERIKEQVRNIGLEILCDDIVAMEAEEDVEKEKKVFELTSAGGRSYRTLSVIIATGATWRHLGVPGEEEFCGKGVSYCATCDAPFFKDKKVVVVGGGDKAVEEAIYLTKFAREVTLIHRRGMLRAVKILQDAFSANKKAALRLHSVVTAVEGDKSVKRVKVKNVETGREGYIDCDGVFIFIGITPNNMLARDKVDVDERGYIVTDKDMRTSAKGIFACGDVCSKSLQQIVVAAGEGALAAYSAQRYVETLKGIAYPERSS